MFYLKEFFSLIKDNRLIGVLFLASSFSLVLIGHNQSKIETMIGAAQKVSSTPYFNALVSGKFNFEGIARKIKSLPGVRDVSLQGKEELDREIKSLKSTFGGHVLENFSNLNFQNMRIDLNRGVQLRSQNLIQEYLSRLIGKSNVTMTDVVKPVQNKRKVKTFFSKILEYGQGYIMVVNALFWMVCLALLMKPLASNSYIIEKFQRKERVSTKIMLFGLGLICTMSIIASFYFTAKISLLTVMVPLLMIIISFVLTFFFSKNQKIQVY